ncbi:MAG: serine hydrolase [Pseudomonadota bacterium]
MMHTIAPGRRARLAAAVLVLATTPDAMAQTDDAFDYFSGNRQLIRNGVQAVLTCNGLFTSQRTLQQVFDQELAYLKNPVGTADGGNYVIAEDKRAVSIGGGEDGPAVRAAFREGIGCVVMAPDQTFDDIDELPEMTLPYPNLASDRMPWPNGDLVDASLRPDGVEEDGLAAASRWAFERDTPEQDTLSLIVVYRGQIVHERYAPGITRDTRTRTWSTAKSIFATLAGMLVDDGRLALDEPLDLPWLPDIQNADDDPRDDITLRHVLNMASGLYPVDSYGMEYATGSGLAYWAGASSVEGALRRGLIREPGTYWEYENYDTLLAVYAMKRALGDEKTYAEFPRRALFDRIGMRSTLPSTDRFGDFIFSSQVYTTARDLARFGLLYAQGGVWHGERLISKAWIDFVTTPAPSTEQRGNFYGGQFWLVPDTRNDVPRDAYATAGNRGQYVIVVPSHDAVIVRRGLDYGKQGFNRWDLTREVLKALRPVRP